MTIVEALKKFYKGNAYNEHDLKEADSVLDAIRAKYGPYEGANIAEYLQTAIVNGVTPGSGGGGGDFNTAEVTVKLSTEHGEGSSFGLIIPADYEPPYYGFFGIFAMPDNTFSDRVEVKGDAITCTLYYAGDSIALQPNNEFESCTGNAVFDPDTYTVIISGDCIVTGWTVD